jgi:hypothetical protein
MKRGELSRVFALDAERHSEVDGPKTAGSLRAPTVDERAHLYLRAVHGPREFTSEEMSRARNRILDAIAADVATRLGISAPSSVEDPAEAYLSNIDPAKPRSDIYAMAPSLDGIRSSADCDYLDSCSFAADEKYHTPRIWRTHRFWMRSGAVGLLAVALMVVIGSMVWRSLQQGGYSTDAGTTNVADWTKGSKLTPAVPASKSISDRLLPEGPGTAQSSFGSLKEPTGLPIASGIARLAPQLSINSVAPHEQDEPAPLGASLRNNVAQESILIMGLPDGSTLSAGQPEGNSWRLAAADLNGVLVRPPRGFVGGMDLTLEVRLADVVVERRSLRLEWIRPVPEPH